VPPFDGVPGVRLSAFVRTKRSKALHLLSVVLSVVAPPPCLPPWMAAVSMNEAQVTVRRRAGSYAGPVKHEVC